MNIALTDLETTGLDPFRHEIIEIGCVVFDRDTLEIKDSFNIKVKPKRIKDAHPEALRVNGYNAKEWRDAICLKDAMEAYIGRVQGSVFMAHNMSFDWGFLVRASSLTGIPLVFQKEKIDLLSIAWSRIPRNKVQGYSLKTICAYLRIEPEPAIHRALNGAMKEYEVYRKLTV